MHGANLNPLWLFTVPTRTIYVVIRYYGGKAPLLIDDKFAKRLVETSLSDFGSIDSWRIHQAYKMIEVNYSDQQLPGRAVRYPGAAAAQHMQRVVNGTTFENATLYVTYADIRRLIRPARFSPARAAAETSSVTDEEVDFIKKSDITPSPAAPVTVVEKGGGACAASSPVTSSDVKGDEAFPSPPAHHATIGSIQLVCNLNFNLDEVRAALAEEQSVVRRTEFLTQMRAMSAAFAQLWDDTIKSLQDYCNSLPPSRTLDDFKCVVCMTNFRNCMGGNCSHVHLCEGCAVRIVNTTKVCPWCNVEFVTFRKVIF